VKVKDKNVFADKWRHTTHVGQFPLWWFVQLLKLASFLSEWFVQLPTLALKWFVQLQGVFALAHFLSGWF